ncbi:hypothetical protein [Bradyrhizobium sp. CSA207]|nr:hypothetical protein [Bradyrhizobium sp. CSA207]
MDRANALLYAVLRAATIGYNVSIEKPVVVRHDARLVPFGRLLD